MGYNILKQYRNLYSVFLVAFLIATGLLGHGQAFSQGSSGSAPLSGIAASKAKGVNASELLTRARENGSVKVIIKLKTNGMSASNAQDSIQNDMAAHNVSNIKRYNHIPYMALEVSENGLNGLFNNPLVEEIEDDIAVDAFLAESGPLIGATTANSSGYTGAGQTVAVLDTGVQYDHSFLTGRVVHEACYTSDSDCPTGNYGSTGTGASMDGHGHGTHVAGIIAGTPGVNGSLVGVAPDADIIGIKVLSNAGSGSYSGILAGLDHIYSLRNTYDIASINMSLGGGSSTSECDASYPAMTTTINNLASAGIATVIASGNDYYTNRISFPGCISTAVSVGSTCDAAGGSYCSSVDAVAAYSNSASFLDILAPGSYITSSTKNSGWGYGWSGTSMATPQVAGAWAVIKASGGASSVSAILAVLQSTGVSVTDSRNSITKMRIQVDDAVGAVAGSTMSSPTDGSTLSGSTVEFTWTDASATAYALYIGTTSGDNDIANISAGAGTSTTVADLPTDGSAIYVQLRWQISGVWNTNDYTYTAAPNPAAMTSPASGSTLSGATQTFTWNDASATSYSAYLGTTLGGSDLGVTAPIAGLSAVLGTFPADGSTVYVRLRSQIGGVWYFNDYSYVAHAEPAVISSPVNASTLSGSSETFTWNAAAGATFYHLNVGSSPGGYDYFYTYGYTTNTSATATGLPTDGSTVYVRLWTNIGGSWYLNDYSYTAASSVTKASISTPVSGSTFSGSSETFAWNSVAGATLYYLNVGSSAGASDYFQENTASTSSAATGIPTDGNTVYVRLGTQISGSWNYYDYSYTAASAVSKAIISTPVNGSTLSGATETFTWNAVAGATFYHLNVGSSPGGYDYFYTYGYTTNTSVAATGLPTDGSTVYVRLWTNIGGSWLLNDYSYTAASAVTKASVTTPVSGSTFSGSSETFAWNSVAGATLYYLNVGSSAGASDYFQENTTSTSSAATGIPTDGSTVHVRLGTQIGGSWNYNDYSYTAASAVSKAIISAPVNGSTLSGSSETFTWNAVAGATLYHLNVGSSPGGYDHFYTYGYTTNTSATATGLPTDGSTVYVRLWTNIGGSWSFNDYSYTAATGGTPTKALVTSPSGGSTLSGSSVTFFWDQPTTVQHMNVGSSLDDSDIGSYSSLNGTGSVLVTGLPTDGSQVFVTLYSYYGGSWYADRQTFTAFSSGPARAIISSPVNGSTLSGSSETFTWNAVAGATLYHLNVGSSPGGYDYFYTYGYTTNTSAIATGLPTDGSTVYVRLWTYVGGSWLYNDYSYTAF